jgi:hypothetical protein
MGLAAKIKISFTGQEIFDLLNPTPSYIAINVPKKTATWP